MEVILHGQALEVYLPIPWSLLLYPFPSVSHFLHLVTFQDPPLPPAGGSSQCELVSHSFYLELVHFTK
jgi:hypothetical protein